MIEAKKPVQYIRDPEMYRIVKNSIHGGMVFVNKRHEKSNFSEMIEYDKASPTKHILFCDVNSLYSYALRLPLPIDDFAFMTMEEIHNFDVMEIPVDGSRGYLVTADISIPNALHDMLDKMPPAPERIFLSPQELSQGQRQLIEEFKSVISHPLRTEKLILNLYDKKEYTVHHKTLQTYIRLGARLGKIHSVISFTQNPNFRDYVDFVISERIQAADEVTKLIKTLQLNSLYGAVGRDKAREINLQIKF